MLREVNIIHIDRAMESLVITVVRAVELYIDASRLIGEEHLFEEVFEFLGFDLIYKFETLVLVLKVIVMGHYLLPRAIGFVFDAHVFYRNLRSQ